MTSLKTLRTYHNLIEAEGACSYLKAHGIEATLPDRHALYHQPHLLEVWGGARVQVDEDQFEEADQLLSKVEKRSHLSPVEPHPSFSEDRKKTSVKWMARFVVLFTLIYWAVQWISK